MKHSCLALNTHGDDYNLQYMNLRILLIICYSC